MNGSLVRFSGRRGLLVLTAGEKVLRLAPPLVVEPGDCKRALEIVGDALRKSPA